MNDMLNMTENYVEETIELIKLSGHVVADRLVFEPLSDTSFEVFADFASVNSYSVTWGALPRSCYSSTYCFSKNQILVASSKMTVQGRLMFSIPEIV